MFQDHIEGGLFFSDSGFANATMTTSDYQWTRKVRGKTVTVRLSPEEAALMREWIANGRQLGKLVSRMETLSLQVTERMLRQVRIS